MATLPNNLQRKHRHRLTLRYRLFKRTADVVLSLLALLLVAPLLAGCMAWIYLIDGGPVLYFQWRVGRDGWLFEMCKLRTMSRDAETKGIRFAQRRDPRVLPGCSWMRRSHVDELPQLLSVLTGKMSLVGPRPERPEVFERYRGQLPQFEHRLSAPPGLTGLAQVRHGYANDLDGMQRKLNYDLEYLCQRSVRGELRLMLATIPKLWDRAAC